MATKNIDRGRDPELHTLIEDYNANSYQGFRGQLIGVSNPVTGVIKELRLLSGTNGIPSSKVVLDPVNDPLSMFPKLAQLPSYVVDTTGGPITLTLPYDVCAVNDAEDGLDWLRVPVLQVFDPATGTIITADYTMTLPAYVAGMALDQVVITRNIGATGIANAMITLA